MYSCIQKRSYFLLEINTYAFLLYENSCLWKSCGVGKLAPSPPLCKQKRENYWGGGIEGGGRTTVNILCWSVHWWLYLNY